MIKGPITLSRSLLRSLCQTINSSCTHRTNLISSPCSGGIISAPYSQDSTSEREDRYELVSLLNRDPESPPKLFVVQPRMRPDSMLQAKLNEALCLANSLEEQRDGYFDTDFFDKEIPSHIVVQNPSARGHKTRAGRSGCCFCEHNSRTWGKPVLDRVGLIIEIFNAHAYTKEGKLQAELAALSYKKTRLVRVRGSDGRLTFGSSGESEVVSARGRGSGGRGFISGAGETELQLQRRRIIERRRMLLSQIEEVRRTRALQRAARKRRGGSDGQGLVTVAVVGYTNAGKSTLVGALSNSDLYSDSRLFATVDPRLRSVVLPSGKKVLVSDTVGFISDLPVQLVEAFHATLEEVVEADLLVHVLDCTAPNLDEHRSTVLSVLVQLGVSKEKLQNMIEVWNKIDYHEDDIGVLDYQEEEAEDEDEDEEVEASNVTPEELVGDHTNDNAYKLSTGDLEAVDDQEDDYSDGWLASEDDQNPWSDENGSMLPLKSADGQQSECSKDWKTEMGLHPQDQSGPHVKTSALTGVGLQELLELIDERLKDQDKKLNAHNVVERSIFNRKWRPPREEEDGIADSTSEREDRYELVSLLNRDRESLPKLFVVQPRMRPDSMLQAKLNEALCLANSLEEQRDGYFDTDFFDKEIPSHIVVQNPFAREHKTRAERRRMLLSQIEEVRRTRALQRAARKRRGGSDGQGLVTVAVVGYTNAVGYMNHITFLHFYSSNLLKGHVLDCTAPNLNLDDHRSTILSVLVQLGVSKEKLQNMIEVWNKILKLSMTKTIILMAEDDKNPWSDENGSMLPLKSADGQQSECSKDSKTEMGLHPQDQSGPHVKTSALTGVGLQELLELIDERLKDQDKKLNAHNVVERSIFNRKWRPPREEKDGIAVEK
ncbi:hypothetical protein G4B88_017611 [Cannabis sativa]|uniref:Hflx-type G domain-containing protein n=1 Tax=Cannabis sativa TaxID=3483 RepID=A0A7J6I505_CANSA|nr:hypothetical protein G4B88_017611 [Cannabis sativa]